MYCLKFPTRGEFFGRGAWGGISPPTPLCVHVCMKMSIPDLDLLLTIFGFLCARVQCGVVYRHDRSSVIVATKVRLGNDNLSDSEVGLSRGSILTNLDNSLKRLQTDYIDLYYVSILYCILLVNLTLCI